MVYWIYLDSICFQSAGYIFGKKNPLALIVLATISSWLSILLSEDIFNNFFLWNKEPLWNPTSREGANKQVISSQADSLIKISRFWADFFPANTSNQPI